MWFTKPDKYSCLRFKNHFNQIFFALEKPYPAPAEHSMEEGAEMVTVLDDRLADSQIRSQCTNTCDCVSIDRPSSENWPVQINSSWTWWCVWQPTFTLISNRYKSGAPQNSLPLTSSNQQQQLVVSASFRWSTNNSNNALTQSACRIRYTHTHTPNRFVLHININGEWCMYIK